MPRPAPRRKREGLLPLTARMGELQAVNGSAVRRLVRPVTSWTASDRTPPLTVYVAYRSQAGALLGRRRGRRHDPRPALIWPATTWQAIAP
jgi:hypothetical protein